MLVKQGVWEQNECYWFMAIFKNHGQLFWDSWSCHSSKGSIECSHLQVITNECEGSCLWINIVMSTHKVASKNFSYKQHYSH